MLRFLFILPIILSLSSCNSYQFDRIFIENSEWKDDEGLVDIKFEGRSNNIGIGTILIFEEYKKAKFSFSTFDASFLVWFKEDTNESYSANIPNIEMGYGPKKIFGLINDYSILKLTVNGGNDSNDSSWDGRQIFINRYAIPDNELDAKYYYDADFCNDELELKFENDYDYNAVILRVITGTYGENEATLSYLDDQKFTIYSEDLLLAGGSYDTYEDKVVLNLDEGTLLDEGNSSIDLDMYYASIW